MATPKKQKKIVTINTTEALDIIRKHQGLEKTTLPSLILWCKRYDMGSKFIGRWRIDKEKLLTFLEKGTG